jgi:hypothetical protein
MANVHLHLASFNAGELSPLLGARFAVEKVQSGCRRLRNFIPHVHGPAFRRPGMEHMGASMGDGAKSRLQGFNFSTSTGFVLEFHPNGLAVWSNGLLVPLRTEVALPYTEQECLELQVAQVNDVTYITHPNHEPRRLVRYADDDWRLEAIDWVWPALGDENVRPIEIGTPSVTEELSVPTYVWKEAKPVGTYVFTVSNPDLTSAVKIAKLQQLSDTGWVTRKTLSWTTVAPGTVGSGTPITGNINWRITFSGPASAGQTIAMNWAGGGLIPNGSLTVDASVALPRIDAEATVPAGEWQTTVDCPATIPNEVTLQLQKKVGASWVDYKKPLTLTPGQIVITRQETLTAATTFRFRWTGRAMNDGTAKIESIVFPVSNDITVAVDAVNGTDRTMTASSAIFLPGHVGSFWQIVHRRDDSSVSLSRVGCAGLAVPRFLLRNPARSAFRENGRFTPTVLPGTLYLERKVGGTWETLRSWESDQDRNVIASGEEDNEVELRLRISSGVGIAASTASHPRFVLEASDARVYGLVKDYSRRHAEHRRKGDYGHGGRADDAPRNYGNHVFGRKALGLASMASLALSRFTGNGFGLAALARNRSGCGVR